MGKKDERIKFNANLTGIVFIGYLIWVALTEAGFNAWVFLLIVGLAFILEIIEWKIAKGIK